MAILLQKAHPQKLNKLLANSMYILGCCEVQLYGYHAHAGRAKYDFAPYKTVCLHNFEHYDVTNGHFAQKGHPQKFTKLLSQLHVYPRMLLRTILC